MSRQAVVLVAVAAHFAAILTVCVVGVFGLLRSGRTILSGLNKNGARETGGQTRAEHERLDPPTMLAKTYLHLAGIEAGYGFFAPNVPDAFRLQIAVLDGKTRVIQSGLVAAEGSETDLRLASLLDALGRSPAGEVRDIIFELMAQAVFEKFPEAAEIRFQVEAIRMPALAQFQKDRTPSYQPAYAYDFGRTDIRPSLAP